MTGWLLGILIDLLEKSQMSPAIFTLIKFLTGASPCPITGSRRSVDLFT